jgi:hypothetical protein
MKKIGLIGIIFCLILVGFSFYASRQTLAEVTDTGEFLTKAFNVTEAEVEGYSIHNWSVLDKEYRTPEELKALALKLKGPLGLQQAKEAQEAQGDKNSYVLRGQWKDGSDVSLTLNSMKFQEQAPQTVLAIRIEREASDLQTYASAIRLVREAVRGINAVPQISTCIKGLLPDKMKDGETNDLVETVFHKVKAKEIEGVRSGLVTSVSGFSPLTKDYIVTNGNRMNLQVAVHYDAQQGKTRVIVGSPIVTIEY